MDSYKNSPGSLSGAPSGNSSGNLSGNLYGNLSGSLSGNLSGNSSGAPSGNSPGNLSGNSSGSLPAVPSAAPVPSGGDETTRLLRELVETQKKSTRMVRLVMGSLCVTLLITAVLTVLGALWTARQVAVSMEQVSRVARTVETAVDQAGRTVSRLGEFGEALADGDLSPETLSGLSDALSELTGSETTLADSVRSFQEGVESFRSVMEKLNGIDFDALNQSIQDLSGMAAPFRQFSGLFGG